MTVEQARKCLQRRLNYLQSQDNRSWQVKDEIRCLHLLISGKWRSDSPSLARFKRGLVHRIRWLIGRIAIRSSEGKNTLLDEQELVSLKVLIQITKYFQTSWFPELFTDC